MPTRWIVVPLCLIAGLCGGAGPFSITPLESLPSNGSTPRVMGINDQGQVVGYQTYLAPVFSDAPHALVWDTAGRATDLNTPARAGLSGAGSSINSSGVVLGTWGDGPAIYRGASVTPLGAGLGMTGSRLLFGAINDRDEAIATGVTGAPSAYFPATGAAYRFPVGTTARSINNAGQVVGSVGSSALLWTAAAGATPIDPPAGYSSIAAWDINDKGRIAGTAVTSFAGIHRAFWYDADHGLQLLPGLDGYANADAIAINDRGQIIGQAYNAATASVPVLWQDGNIVELSTLLPSASGWTLLSAVDINDGGSIAAMGRKNGTVQGLVLVAIPEPASLLACGAALALLHRRRRSPR